MKDISKTFGNVILFFGIIGSIFIASFYGKSLNYHNFELERNWILTIILFVSCALPSTVLSVILYAIGEILENQELVFKALNISVKQNNKASGNSHDVIEKAIQSSVKTRDCAEEVPESSWRCSVCGHINNNLQFTCDSCKSSRPSSKL